MVRVDVPNVATGGLPPGMSGICAILRGDTPEGLVQTLTSANQGLSLSPTERAEQETDPGMGIGVSARFHTQQIYRSPRVLVACDADLLNESELRALVPDRGQAATGAKTAALLTALYERFGCDFVERLRGAFSVVLWDRHERKLIAAIDGFGMNRLVYSSAGKTLMVASRAHALVATGEVDLAINPHTIPNLLNFGMNLAPETVFTKIHRLPPGCLLLASDGQLVVKPYWDMRYGVGGDDNENRLSEELESRFEACVAAHCHSQTFETVGAFLSGGTDTVVGMMSRMGKGQARAFSIGFQEQPFNELDYARIAAAKFQAQHHTYLVGPEDCFQALPGMVRFFDEPFGNSSAIPTYFCARLAAQNGVKVLLAGDGGDELFGGNERYATDKIYEMYHSVPRALRTGIIEPLLSRMPMEGGPIGRMRRYVKRAGMSGVDRILCHQFLATNNPADIFQEDFLAALGDYSIFDVPRHYYEDAPARESLDRILYADVKLTLGDSDLPKVTCMAEMAGIQVRFPFLDRGIAEFSGRLPARLKVKGFQKRYLFKKAFGNLLPAEIIKKKKHGFGIPVAGWLKSDPKLRELSRDTLLSRTYLEGSYFRKDFIERLFRQHETDDTSFYGDTIWVILILELWRLQLVETPVGMSA
jgi:asparagine synthase (glutamine-hydrolysing)